MRDRVLIDSDTLHIGFHGSGKAPYPEDIVSGGVLRALAQHLKIDLQTEGMFWGDYCYFAGVQGEAFRFIEFMKVSGEFRGSVVERYGNTSRVESFRHAFDAAGLTFEAHMKPGMPEKATLKQQIVQSLRDRNTPVIGFGYFAPPEPFLITGYDEGGEVLLGWSHFQAEKKDDVNLSFEPGGQFRLENWYDQIDGVMIVTGTKERPAAKEIYKAALLRGIKELRTTQGAGGAVGAAAMEKWAAHLENEADFAGFSEEQWKKANSDHGGTAGDLAERRALAGSFVELAAGVFPEAEKDLNIARACFGGAHDTVYEIWEMVANTGPFDPDVEKFKDLQYRRTMAGLVRRLAAFDRRAGLALQRAVNVIEGKDAGAELPADDLLDGNVRLLKAEPETGEAARIWAPENIHIANSMCMLQEFLGEPFGELNEAERAQKKLAYSLWMGFTGAAFGLLDDAADRSNVTLAMDALGYEYELWVGSEMAKEIEGPCRVFGWDDNFRRRIFWNLRDRRLPVVLFNCGPWPDWWLVTGAEHWGDFRGYGGNNGEGYRPNEPLDDPKNALREIEFFDGIKGKQPWTINLLSRRTTPKPTMEKLYERAVAFGADRMREPRMRILDASGNERMGREPYGDWAEMMKTDALFPAGDAATLKSRRSWLEGFEVELAERRHYGANFLEMAAIRLRRPELKEAAGHFRNVNKLVERIWAETGGMGAPEGHLKYADKAVRGRIAEALLEIEREEAAAAALLAK